MIQNLTQYKGASHPISKLMRPVFEKKSIKAIIGGFFSATSLASGLALLPGDVAGSMPQPIITNPQVQIETQKGFVNVVPENTGVSQYYHIGHPGIDITAPLGTQIYPIKAGVVVRMENLKWDYGRAVYVDHGNGMISLYAHMGKIYVEEGEVISTEKPIGEIGVTGRTTGPHLHFEIRKNGVSVNPSPFLNLTK